MQTSRLESSDKKTKILVYLFGSLGDTLVAIPALRAVRRHFANTEIIVLQNTQSENIVKTAQVIPEDLVDGYLSYDSGANKTGQIFNFYNLWRKIRKQNFQAAVYLVISERAARSVARDRLFFRSCGIKKLYGFHAFTTEELYPFDSQNRPAMTDNEAVRKLRRLQSDGIDFDPEADFKVPFLNFAAEEMEKVKTFLSAHRKTADSRLISIAPGCKTESNVWSLENFTEIGKRLLNFGNYELVVVGGKPELESGDHLIQIWNEGINAAGEFSVRESGYLLSKCDFHIGLDTGTTHLAAMVGTKCFAIYGERNNPGHWYPLGSGHEIIYHPVECAGCRLQVCPLSNHPCMRGISVEAVWDNLKKFIDKEAKQKTAQAAKIIAV